MYSKTMSLNFQSKVNTGLLLKLKLITLVLTKYINNSEDITERKVRDLMEGDNPSPIKFSL